MSSSFKIYKKYWLIFILSFYTYLGFSQSDTSTFKAQFALGVNSPSSNGFINNFEGSSINFPTINLGLQYMFKPMLGVKLDLGYNRFSNSDNTPEFKVNYTRINAQLVYNTTNIFSFFPQNMGTFVHAGPGFSMIKPLGNYTQNKTSYLNAMAGIEFHYGVSDKLSVYLDASYILGFSDDFNPISEGFGSFNGNLLTVTIGASISLSGCYYCEQND
ncbi:Outer membrane protein beta-barrel domain-containing protein [Flaviramulus basaltis]|uniref:Outer membrane protein beta-barrel domain-containing protein n=1 Tax=Flaviramulus basaltis TaxID=369401 RepID=A0A1K2IAI7_9FLAO|nr:outer membrane beta-barrel protein [Flaviramulus basaltis]SFZ89421.1 Outer membrane protein beta-barrel domain-containing protein [Flaviramulus basaltis]